MTSGNYSLRHSVKAEAHTDKETVCRGVSCQHVVFREVGTQTRDKTAQRKRSVVQIQTILDSIRHETEQDTT